MFIPISGSWLWIFCHPGSGYRIRESEKHLIPDPDLQHCFLNVHLRQSPKIKSKRSQKLVKINVFSPYFCLLMEDPNLDQHPDPEQIMTDPDPHQNVMDTRSEKFSRIRNTNFSKKNSE
jgi:hypothetical protein